MKEVLKENDFFKSSDLSLITTLQLYGYYFETVDRSNKNKIIFFIKKDEKLDDLIKAFWSRSLRVCPLSYFEALKIVKSRIHQ